MTIKNEAQRKKALAEFRKLCKQIDTTTAKAKKIGEEIHKYEQKAFPREKVSKEAIRKVEKWFKS